MKKARGMIQISVDNCTIQNRIGAFAIRKGLVTVYGSGYYQILDKVSGAETGRLIPIIGNPIIVRILDRLTDYHGPCAKTFFPTYDENGDIIGWSSED